MPPAALTSPRPLASALGHSTSTCRSTAASGSEPGVGAAFGELRGLPARFEQLPTTALDDDNKAMFEWFANPPAYQADINATRDLEPQVLTFAQWLKTVT